MTAYEETCVENAYQDGQLDALCVYNDNDATQLLNVPHADVYANVREALETGEADFYGPDHVPLSAGAKAMVACRWADGWLAQIRAMAAAR